MKKGADMLKRTVFLAAILLAILGVALPSPALAQDSAPPTSSLLVKLVSGLTTEQQADVIARNGGTEVSSIPALRLHVIEVATDQLADTLARYQADPQVVRAEENKTRQAEAAPADPLYSNQWALPMISWDLAFGTVTPTGSVTVAILDTGIDATHPDLAGNVIPGTSILDGTDGLTDPSGHGTWMAGIIAARTNTEGIAGVGYAGVRVMPVTVLDANGLGQDSDVIAGVIWAVEHGANVILMAFSNPGFSDNLQEAIDYAWENGVVLVAAVGNDAESTPTFPAGDRGVIGVSATDSADQLAAFSNDGQAVFLAAPGTDIETTNIGGTYGALSGTSASAAIVAGAAALVKAVDPTLTNGVIVGRLARTADPAGTQEQTGNGRINLARALEDTGTDFVEPSGADPVGSGGPFVGPYKAAASALTLTPNSGVAGTSVSAAFSGGGFTGNTNITITFNGSGVSTAPNPCRTNGGGNVTCTFTAPSLSAGPYTVSGTDGRYTFSATFTVTGKIDPTVTFTGAPASAPYQGTFTVASTTNSTASPAYTSSGACSNVGTVYTMTSATGTCTSTVTWATDANYNGATRSQTTAAQKATQAALTVNAGSPLTYNTSETLTTSGGSGGGAVSYSVTAGSCSVLGDQLTANSGSGTCSVTATKAADANYNAVTAAAATVTLQKADQAAVIVSAPSDATFGLAGGTATASGGNGSGAYSFSAGASTACTVDSSTGAITVTSGTGTCAITAMRAGDSNYNDSATSLPASVTIHKADQTGFTLTVPTSITYGATGTATTSGGNGTGTVSFSSSGSTGCSVDAGTGVISVSNASGTCSISATKAGDSNYNAATDGPKPVTLQKVATSTAVVSDNNPAAAGSAVTFTATVTSSAAGTITGLVEFFDGGASLGTQPLSAGTASLSTSVLAVGSHSITAVYNGDDNFNGSTSASLSQVVDTPPTDAADWYAVLKDGTLTVTAPGVLANDADVDAGPTLQVYSPVAVDTATAHGTLHSLHADGSFSYTPTAGFTGTDSFTYQATDGFIPGNLVTVTITVVDPAVTKPVAEDDVYSATKNTTLAVVAPGVLGNDNHVIGHTAGGGGGEPAHARGPDAAC